MAVKVRSTIWLSRKVRRILMERAAIEERHISETVEIAILAYAKGPITVKDPHMPSPDNANRLVRIMDDLGLPVITPSYKAQKILRAKGFTASSMDSDEAVRIRRAKARISPGAVRKLANAKKPRSPRGTWLKEGREQ